MHRTLLLRASTRIRGAAAVAAGMSVTGLAGAASLETQDPLPPKHSEKTHVWHHPESRRLFGMIYGGSIGGERVLCEGTTNMEEEKEQQEDPYDNLPDTDEPTTCTICLVNRQGPCRPEWRKMETCMKDQLPKNEGTPTSEGNAKKCDKYMMPWLMCTHSYKNLYLLYFNKVYQAEFIDPMEAAVREDEYCKFACASQDSTGTCSMEEPAVDWTPWMEHLQGAPSFNDTSETSPETTESAAALLPNDGGADPHQKETARTDSHPPAAKPTGEEWSDPDIVELSVTILLKESDTGMPIEVAYAKDQTGAVVGFELFSKYKEDTEDSDEKEDETKKNAEQEKSKKDENKEASSSSSSLPPTTGVLRLSLQPGQTQSLQIHALYKDGDKARLYSGRRWVLPQPVATNVTNE